MSIIRFFRHRCILRVEIVLSISKDNMRSQYINFTITIVIFGALEMMISDTMSNRICVSTEVGYRERFYKYKSLIKILRADRLKEERF